jgi:hypothetical protein
MKNAGLAIFFAVICNLAHAFMKDSSLLNPDCEIINSMPAGQVVSVAIFYGNMYRIEYDRKSSNITLTSKNNKTALQHVPKERDPSMVGAEDLIGFLNDSFQIYKERNILIYTSAMRTNSGGVNGQCGTGAEIYLNFLELKSNKPRIISRILIGSCSESIIMTSESSSEAALGDIFIKDKNLVLHFLNYKKLDGSPFGTISPDFKGLLFNEHQ